MEKAVRRLGIDEADLTQSSIVTNSGASMLSLQIASSRCNHQMCLYLSHHGMRVMIYRSLVKKSTLLRRADIWCPHKAVSFGQNSRLELKCDKLCLAACERLREAHRATSLRMWDVNVIDFRYSNPMANGSMPSAALECIRYLCSSIQRATLDYLQAWQARFYSCPLESF